MLGWSIVYIGVGGGGGGHSFKFKNNNIEFLSLKIEDRFCLSKHKAGPDKMPRAVPFHRGQWYGQLVVFTDC